MSIAKKKIFIAGHNGMVGRCLSDKLHSYGSEILTIQRSELDLRDQKKVHHFLQDLKPDIVIIAAAKVGGILANDSYPVDFLEDNLRIQNNLISSSYKANVEKLLFLGSSCIYPKFSKQPIKEEYLLSGQLERTNEWYAIAKIAGIKLCQAYRKQYGCNFISAMPTNLYGYFDNFDLESSHVIPALINKIHHAKINNDRYVELWGTGTARREFLFVEDLADALILLIETYSNDIHINVGYGSDVTIRELADIIKQVVGYDGSFKFNTNLPDGTPQKLLDISRLQEMGWKPKINLVDGLEKTYNWYQKNYQNKK